MYWQLSSRLCISSHLVAACCIPMIRHRASCPVAVHATPPRHKALPLTCQSRRILLDESKHGSWLRRSIKRTNSDKCIHVFLPHIAGTEIFHGATTSGTIACNASATQHTHSRSCPATCQSRVTRNSTAVDPDQPRSRSPAHAPSQLYGHSHTNDWGTGLAR